MEHSHALNPTFLPATYDPHFHGSPQSNVFLSKMPYRRLGQTGLDVSLLGYGGGPLGNFYGDFAGQKSIDTIRSCLKNGVNYIDTAPFYGDSEAVIGQALNGIPRNTFYIGTKVGRYFTPSWQDRFDFSHQAVLNCVEKSLKLLGLSYLDVIQVHDVEFCLDPKIIIHETLPALESLVKAGKAKFIGITGYPLTNLKEILDSSHVKIDTVLSYCRYNFHDSSLLDYLPYFKAKNLGIINAAPLSLGLYTSRGPPEWHPALDEIKQATRKVASHLQAEGKTIEDEALGFGLRPDDLHVATTLVGMPNEEVMKRNLEITTTSKTSSDRALHEKLQGMYQEMLKGPCNWEGVEVSMYKNAIKNQRH